VNNRRLYRSEDDRVIAGVCGGVADYFNIDPVIVRILWFLSFFFTGSLTFWAYVVMAIVVPICPDNWQPQSPWAPGGAPIGGTGYPVAGGDPAGAPSPVGYAQPGDAPAADATTGSTPAGATAPWQAGPGGGWSGDWHDQRRQERWERRQERRAKRAERHEAGDRTPGIVFGLLLVLVGGLLAWHQVDPRFDIAVTWPVAVIALGAILVVSSIRPGNRQG
jgi:phage shock protein C